MLSGLVSISMLLLHGATYAALKADASLAVRAGRSARILASAFVVLYLTAGAWLMLGLPGYVITSTIVGDGPSSPLLKQVAVQGHWFAGFAAHPTFWLAPALAIAAAFATILMISIKRYFLAFVASALVCAGTILSAGFALFPFLMPSSLDPNSSLTVWDASSSRGTLGLMLVMVLIFLPIVIAYTSWAYRVLRGRVTLEHIRSSHGGGY
jgi:cytochrome d ubiquinol oxidase subunit II